MYQRKKDYEIFVVLQNALYEVYGQKPLVWSSFEPKMNNEEYQIKAWIKSDPKESEKSSKNLKNNQVADIWRIPLISDWSTVQGFEADIVIGVCIDAPGNNFGSSRCKGQFILLTY